VGASAFPVNRTRETKQPPAWAVFVFRINETMNPSHILMIVANSDSKKQSKKAKPDTRSG
jgi:hypothetical protein